MADIWACGIIMYFLLTGKHPFITGEEKTEEVKEKIINFKEICFPSSISSEAKHLL